MSANQVNKSVKPQAIKLLKQIEDKLQEAVYLAQEVEELGGDNEADNLATTLKWSITKDKNMLHRSIQEALELW